MVLARSDTSAAASADASGPPVLMASRMKLATCGATRTARVLPIIRPTLIVVLGVIRGKVRPAALWSKTRNMLSAGVSSDFR